MGMRTTHVKIKTGLAILIALTLMTTGCSVLKSKKDGGGAVEPPKAQTKYLDFGDVLLPKELKMDRDDSFVFTTSGLTAGVISLSGRVEVSSLITFFENRMPEDGWHMVSAIKSAQSMLLFKKQARWCVISITEGQLSTEVKVWVAPTIGSEMDATGLHN